jgi:hypothetical protein
VFTAFPEGVNVQLEHRYVVGNIGRWNQQDVAHSAAFIQNVFELVAGPSRLRLYNDSRRFRKKKLVILETETRIVGGVPQNDISFPTFMCEPKYYAATDFHPSRQDSSQVFSDERLAMVPDEPLMWPPGGCSSC